MSPKAVGMSVAGTTGDLPGRAGKRRERDGGGGRGGGALTVSRYGSSLGVGRLGPW